MPRNPQQPSLPQPKETMAERARRDFPEPHAHPCRSRTAEGTLVFLYLGWLAEPPFQGHACRYWTGEGWSEPTRIHADDLRRSVRADLPPGATIPEGPIK